MHSLLFATPLFLLVVLLTGVDASPTPKYVARHRSRSVKLAGLNVVNGEVKPNSYIVKMKPCSSSEAAAHIAWATEIVSNSTASNATAPKLFSTSSFHGYAAEVDEDSLAKMINHESVDWIQEDGLVYVSATQTDATWGLSRLSQVGGVAVAAQQNPTALTFTYNFPESAGQGVDVYVFDTGVLTTHQEFGGRAQVVYTTHSQGGDDKTHGSHCAGIIAGQTFGVAKAANIKDVQVFAADGTGATSDIIGGLNFVIKHAAEARNPSVISMSFGGPRIKALDQAVSAAVAQGIHVVVGAGNEAQDVEDFSPANVPEVITVGAMTIADTVAPFSNFGAGVDIFAPGQDILSVGIKSDTDMNVLSGTSMAAPHVAGLVALFLSENFNPTPAQMSEQIKSLSLKGALTADPRLTNTPNRIAQIDVAWAGSE